MSNFIVSAPEGSSIPIIDAGVYSAVCIGIIDIGEQYNKMYDKFTRKCIFQFEIPDERIEIDGAMKPRVISETYTASLAEKANLRKTLESWRGREFTQDELAAFDLENVLGAPCMLNIIHKENNGGGVFAKIQAIMRIPKGVTVETDSPKIIFSLNDADALDRIGDFPEWIQKRIKESKTYDNMLSSSFEEVQDEEPSPF